MDVTHERRDSGKYVEAVCDQLAGFSSGDLDTVLERLHHVRMVRRNPGVEAAKSADQVRPLRAGEVPGGQTFGLEGTAHGDRIDVANTSERSMLEERDRVAKVLESSRLAGNGADVQSTKGVDQMQQPLSHQLRQLANTSHVAHLAAHALERLEQRQAKRRAELERSQLVPRLMAAAWNAMQVNRRQPIPVWLAELVELTREAAGVLLEDIPTQGPRL